MSCKKEAIEVSLIKQPGHFPKPHYNFANFELNQAGIDLGKALFYDPILSFDNSISCASCHHQSAGFSDPGKVFSIGVDDSLSDRNSIGLVNLIWSPTFFWDGGVNHIELTGFAPINNVKEMKEDMNHIVAELYQDNDYRALFLRAYNEDTITAQRVLWSLAAYMATLISSESYYDRVYKGEASFNVEQDKGYKLFQRDCVSCHTEPLTSNYNFENNGLDEEFEDLGRAQITLNASDRGKFKVPSLRNITLTAPYMHDGRFNTLNEVIDHYSDGIKMSATLSNKLPEGFHYTASEKKALIKFLETLVDPFFVQNPDFN